MIVTYTIPDYGFNKVQDTINRLNKRATKLGLKPIQLNVINTYEKEYIDYKKGRVLDPYGIGSINSEQITSVVVMRDVEIIGEEPIIKGWRFVAVIEHGQDGRNIVRSMEETPSKYKTIEPKCEHCNVNRYRTKTYILYNEREGYKQVGSSCLRDFLGTVNIQELAEYSEGLFSCYDEISSIETEFDYDSFYEGRGHSSGIKTSIYLSCVAAVIRARGWTSVSDYHNSGRTPTSHNALDIYFGKKNEYLEGIIVCKKDVDIAKEALEWIERQSEKTNLNDYMWNLTTICTRKYLDPEHINIAASLIYSYNRAREKAIAAGTDKSNWQGVVGEKLTVVVTISNIIETEGYYGKTYITKMVDNKGNLYVWFTSSKKVEIGNKYEVTGKVKKHDDYQGTKQTVLTRCKVKEIISNGLL